MECHHNPRWFVCLSLSGCFLTCGHFPLAAQSVVGDHFFKSGAIPCLAQADDHAVDVPQVFLGATLFEKLQFADDQVSGTPS